MLTTIRCLTILLLLFVNRQCVFAQADDLQYHSDDCEFKKVLRDVEAGKQFLPNSIERTLYNFWRIDLPFVYRLMNDGNYNEVDDRASEIIKLAPNCWIGYYYRAWALAMKFDAGEDVYSDGLNNYRLANEKGYVPHGNFPDLEDIYGNIERRFITAMNNLKTAMEAKGNRNLKQLTVQLQRAENLLEQDMGEIGREERWRLYFYQGQVSMDYQDYTGAISDYQLSLLSGPSPDQVPIIEARVKEAESLLNSLMGDSQNAPIIPAEGEDLEKNLITGNRASSLDLSFGSSGSIPFKIIEHNEAQPGGIKKNKPETGEIQVVSGNIYQIKCDVKKYYMKKTFWGVLFGVAGAVLISM